LIENSKDKEYLSKIVEALTSRTELTGAGNTLNLNEFIFLRRASLAWEQCSQNSEFITKSSI